MTKKAHFIMGLAHILLLGIIFLLFLGSVGYVNPGPRRDNVKSIRRVQVQIGSQEPEIAVLPHVFKDLPPRTPVTITATIRPEPDEEIYVESSYCPGRIYLDHRLGYEFGRPGQYPSFMLDPAPEIRMVETHGYNQPMELRIEFLSPRTQNRMLVKAPLLGSTKEIIMDRFRAYGGTCVLAAAQVIYGISLVAISVCTQFIDKKGMSFLWLGLLSLTSGLWAFGDNNFAGIVVKNSTLLYLLAFGGFYVFIIPLLRFARSIVDYEQPKPIWYLELFLAASSTVALGLQLLGILSCTTSKHFFYAVLPFTMIFLTVYTLREWIIFGNINAKRFIFPVSFVTVTTIASVIGYMFSLTHSLSAMIQVGFLIFLLTVGVAAGVSMKDSIYLRDKQKQLDFEKNLMKIQAKEQKTHSKLLAQQEQMVSQQRHDLRHHLSVLMALAGEDNQELQSYLQSLMDNIPSASVKFCENQVVNAILCHYSMICQQRNIRFTAELAVPEDNPHTPDTALCIVFGNLLENAVEACERMTEGEKFIRIRSRVQYELLTVTMDNSFSGIIRKEGDRFRSSKRDDFGIGLSSVHSIAKKFGGDSEFKAEGNVFLSSVYLNL